ncbi:F-box domain, Leucine-rich repeat domain, L domain-like protein [Artemisia annua]|uniref:F-box domain, Leucine-rich repeat domain, L domain-like protein n=1 Tax=Artemisia annua TaxID=35608 RepID=A0A2U1PWN4_ARTAN|nr:F-box domain, Leucine-rich repeat domain, L domain-like protein [Artemisia annua]
MDYKQVEKRMNAEIDRLSNLPDELIHKILSFVGIKCAIGTSALSSRWRYIWTSMPYLDFSFENFSTSARLSNFVTNVLSRRNNLVQVVSIKLPYRDFSSDTLRQIMNYAFSHNIQQLDIKCFPENDNGSPFPLFCSESLKHLSLRWRAVFTPTSTIELPALTSLYLEDITLSCDGNTEKTDKCIGLFSKCANLKDLTLSHCTVRGLKRLDICHPLLSNLTLQYVHGSLKVVNVVAPQLKNLSISYSDEMLQFLISAPDLVSLCYKNYLHPLYLSTEGFHSLEKVDLCVRHSIVGAQDFVRLFLQLQSVKFLTVNMEILELLSLSVELISNQPSPFANLKSLHIYPARLSELRNGLKMSTETIC